MVFSLVLVVADPLCDVGDVATGESVIACLLAAMLMLCCASLIGASIVSSISSDCVLTSDACAGVVLFGEVAGMFWCCHCPLCWVPWVDVDCVHQLLAVLLRCDLCPHCASSHYCARYAQDGLMCLCVSAYIARRL